VANELKKSLIYTHQNHKNNEITKRENKEREIKYERMNWKVERQLTHDEIQKKSIIPHLYISHPSEQNGWERAHDWLCPNALLIVLLVENECRFNPRQHGIKERSY